MQEIINLFLYRIFFFCIILWGAQQHQKAHLMLYPCRRNTPTSHNCAIHCNMPEAICQYFARYIRIFLVNISLKIQTGYTPCAYAPTQFYALHISPDKQNALKNPRNTVGNWIFCLFLSLITEIS